MNSDRMKSTIAGLALLAMFVGIFLLTSREADSASVAEGKFRVTVDDVTSGGDYFVRRLKFRVNRASGIRLRLGDAGESWMSLRDRPTREDGIVEANVVLMCDMGHALEGDQRWVTWLQQITSAQGMAGGPSRYPVPSDTKMENLVTLNITEGEYNVGHPLTLGQFQNEPIVVTVER